MLVLDCPDGQTGAVALSAPLVAALVQQQTMGQVSARVADARAFTDTDAAMCAPLIEAVLDHAVDLAQTDPDQACFRAIRFGARGEDTRTVHLALRAVRYRVFWLTVDIALGAQQGQIVLVLPDAADLQTVSAAGREPDLAAIASGPLMNVPAQLNAVLTRFRLPVSRLNALQIGDQLELERDKLDDTALVSVTGDMVARGRLGQMNGHRAIRVMPAPSVPRASGDPRPAVSFDTVSPPVLPPDEPPDTFKGVSAPVRQPRADGLTDMETEMTVEALSALDPQDAADEITALAGLTQEDLAAIDATTDDSPLPGGNPAIQHPDDAPLTDLSTPDIGPFKDG